MDSDEIYQHSPYGQLVGTRIRAVDRDRKTIEIEYQAIDEFTNRLGTVAGGMVAGLLDSVTGLVANVLLPEGSVAVHTRLDVRYRRPVIPGLVIGRGSVVEQTDRDIDTRGELWDPAGNRLASADATLRILEQDSPA